MAEIGAFGFLLSGLAEQRKSERGCRWGGGTQFPASPSLRRARRQRRLRPQPWWLTFVVVLAADWVLMRAFAPEPGYVNIPYTLFKEQVQAGNVEEVTSRATSDSVPRRRRPNHVAHSRGCHHRSAAGPG